MDLIHSMHPLARAWLLDGPLSSYVEAFQALLERGRYAEGSSAKALRAWSHFSHWMTKCQLSAEQIDEAIVEQFLDSHLPRCDCHPAALRTRNDLCASLGHLLALLREQHVIVELPGPSGPVAEELARYNTHMRDARGLALAPERIGSRASASCCNASSPAGHRHRRAAARGRPRLHRRRSSTRSTAVATPARSRRRCAPTSATAAPAATQCKPCSAPSRRRRDWSQASLPRALDARGSPAALNSLRRRPAASPLRLAGHRAPGAGSRAARGRDRQAGDWRHRLARRHRDPQAHEVPAPGRPAAAGGHRPSAGGRTCATSDRQPATAPCSSAVWRRTTSPSASTPSSVVQSGVPCDAPASRTAAPTLAPHAGLSPGQQRQLDQGGGRRAAAPLAEHLADLRQARPQLRCRGGAAVARERGMSAPRHAGMLRVEQYLAERRRLGFELVLDGYALRHFARFMSGEPGTAAR